jgi:hypothetical protein
MHGILVPSEGICRAVGKRSLDRQKSAIMIGRSRVASAATNAFLELRSSSGLTIIVTLTRLGSLLRWHTTTC